ncbi:MAG: pyrroline-5-carboxylate reductase [Elusimicrobiota bacterium]|jgi:pyrroline-5-carboxylate reductase|nr:pyrroline-5-carboxylate reductase [Elusimicrobiota bacterium]
MEIAKKIVFIGSGNMAQAIISAILKSEMIKPENIICNDIVKERVDLLHEKFGVSIAVEKGVALVGADIIVLSVKPQNMKSVFDEIRSFIKSDAIIISIAAGIKTENIETGIGKKISVIRAMPNTPALTLSGATALCAGKYTRNEQMQKAKQLFSAIGKVEIQDESKFDAITALSGSGPAYVFYLAQLMAQAGEDLGLDKKIAQEFAAQTIYGAGKMLVETGVSAEELKLRVKSPNGTTEAALNYFEEHNLKDIIFKAMEAAKNRSIELSK